MAKGFEGEGVKSIRIKEGRWHDINDNVIVQSTVNHSSAVRAESVMSAVGRGTREFGTT